MSSAARALVLCAALSCAVAAAENSSGPTLVATVVPIAPPKDQAYPGEIQLKVDATDPIRRIVRVHEQISGIAGETVLLYPKWLPGTHSPEGPIDRVAGLRVTSQGANVPWTRDPVDVYAFRVHAGPGVTAIEIDFHYLSPPNDAAGDIEISRDLLMIKWNNVV